MSSTLLFKFNGFGNLSNPNVLADEIHDVGTNPSEWRESSRPTNARGNPLPEAKDEWGNVWGIHVMCITSMYLMTEDERSIPTSINISMRYS
eukprot:scaffold1186_cov117-Skeletonema_dohrnii-CCMP3373.AAC.8